VVPPLVVASSWAAALNQRNHPYAVPASVVFNAGMLLGMRRLIRRGTTPRDSIVMHALGAPSDAERAAFVDTYRTSLKIRRADGYRTGMVWSGTLVAAFGIAVFRVMAAS
jgi:hypothetical protein